MDGPGPFWRIPYDVEQFPFAEMAAAALGVGRLEELPSVRDRGRAGLERSLSIRDDLTRAGAGGALRAAYLAFVRHVIGPRLGGWISHTSRATYRVQLVGAPGVSAWHRDAAVTGRFDYVNAWVPFLDVDGPSTLWVEDGYEGGDHRPVPVRYGEVLVFDGGLLEHGSVTNDGITPRVSMDFRFVPHREPGRSWAAGLHAARPPELVARVRAEVAEAQGVREG